MDVNRCHSEVAKAKNGLLHPSSMLRMEQLTKPHLNQGPSECVLEQCGHSTVDSNSYRTRYFDDKCTCKDLCVSVNVIDSVLDQDDFLCPEWLTQRALVSQPL